MSFLSLLRVETGRLFHRRLTWLAIAAVALGPLLGLGLYRPLFSSSSTAYATSLSGAYIGNPALAGGLAGALLFGLLTALELDRAHRSRVDALTDTLVSPLAASLARTLALMLAALAAQAIVLAVWLPYAMVKTGAIFSLEMYFGAYLVFMLPSLIFAVLFTSCAYQLTGRLDLTLVLLVAFLLLSMVVWKDNWLLRWANPSVFYLSDDFGNARRLRSAGYSRLFWLLALGALWSFSFLCVRRYGKGIIGSIGKNARRIYLPAIAVALAACSGLAYTGQPFIDHSKEDIDDMSYYEVDYNSFVAYSAIHVDARPDLATGCQWGTAAYTLKNYSGKPQTIAFYANPGYSFSGVTANGAAVPHRDLADDDHNTKTMEVDLPADMDIELVIEYGGFPQEWNIIELSQGDTEISPHCIYLAHQDFAPTPKDIIENGGMEPFAYTVNISLPQGMRPVLFGTGTCAQMGENADGTVVWELVDDWSSIILYAADYVSQTIDAAGVTVEFFYSAKHRRVMEECNVDQVIRQVFDYCSENYAPLKFYRDGVLRLIEIGAGGGYAASGASVMGEDSFNEEGLKDPNKGAGGGEVLAHEIIHQWWGLGNMFYSEDFSDTWSSEGLTVYTTYRLMKQLYGDAYAKEHYVDVWRAQVDDYYKNYYVRHPEHLSALPENYQTDIANSIAQMRQYCEMPLKILKAEELVGGEERMDAILSALFTRDMDNEDPYLAYEQFLAACDLEEEDLELE